MKIFLDTANTAEIKRFADLGLVDGVTTNPTLIAEAKRDFFELIAEIAELIAGPVSAEVIATDFQGMLSDAKKLTKISKHVIVKVPLTFDGLKTCRVLSAEGVSVNVTLCFSALQALLAAKAGATFVSPFVGRLDDTGHEGMNLIEEIRDIYYEYPGIQTQILVASARHPVHALQAAKLGADIITLPPKVLGRMIEHPLTEIGLKKFLSDWKASDQKAI